MAKFFVHILRPRHRVRDFRSQYLSIAMFESVDIRFKRAFGHAELTRRFDLAQSALIARQKLFYYLETLRPALGRILLSESGAHLLQ